MNYVGGVIWPRERENWMVCVVWLLLSVLKHSLFFLITQLVGDPLGVHFAWEELDMFLYLDCVYVYSIL